MHRLRFAVLSSLSLVVACGSKSSEVSPSKTPGEAAPQIAAPPLTPLPTPAEVFAVGRIKNVATLADTAVAWSSLPLNWKAELQKAVPGIDKIAMLSAPVEFAAMLDPLSGTEPRIFWGISAGLVSADAAAGFFRSQGEPVARGADGSYSVHVGTEFECSASPALGAAPARLVCSDSVASTKAMTPYLTRGLPLEQLGTSDVHVQVGIEPFRQRYGAQLTLLRTMGVPFLLRELSLDHPKFDRALREALFGLANEFIAVAYDFDRIELDAAVAGDAVDVGMGLAFSGTRSWTGGMLERAPARMGPPPPIFWQLPADAQSASYGVKGDPERFRPVAVTLGDLLDGFLDYHALAERRRAPLVESFVQFLTMGGSGAYVSTPTASSGSPRRDEGVRGIVEQGLGTHLAVFDQDDSKSLHLASELVKSWNDKAFRDHLVKSKMLVRERLPSAVERAPKAKGLPKGTRVFQITVPKEALDAASFSPFGAGRVRSLAGALQKASDPSKAKAAAPLDVFLILSPDGPQTWAALGASEAALSDLILQAKASKTPRLDTRPGLEALRSGSTLSGGFYSLAELLESVGRSPLLAPRSAAPSSKGMPVAERLPHRGETPILFSATVDAKGPRLSSTIHVPRAFVEDVIAAAASSDWSSRDGR